MKKKYKLGFAVILSDWKQSFERLQITQVEVYISTSVI